MTSALVVTQDSFDAPLGMERVASDFARVLDGLGLDVSCVSTSDLRPPRLNSGLTGKYLGPLAECIATARSLRRERFDVVVTNGPTGAFVSGRVSFHLYHGVYPAMADASIRLSPLGRARMRWEAGTYERLAGRNKVCLANSELTARGVKKWYGHDCDVIWLSVDVDRFRPGEQNLELASSLELSTGRPIGLFVGVGRPNKGAAEAFEIARRTPDVLWLFVGDGQHSALPNVICRERVERELMPDLLRLCSVAISPARYEPFGLVVAEALVTGTPVVTTIAGSAELLLADAMDSPLIVSEASDVDAFVRGVHWALNARDVASVLTKAREMATLTLASEVWSARVAQVIAAQNVS